MIRSLHWIRPFRRWGGSILAITLAVGLTGCYTQLKTTDSAFSGPDLQQSDPEQARTADRADEPRYADEYRREYRDGVGVRYDDQAYDDEFAYRYEYKYKYGAPYRYGYAGFHDPFFHDPFYRPYGPRFAFSIYFGSPLYYRSIYYGHRPLYYSAVSPHYGGPYYGGSYYIGNQYIYYGNGTDDQNDRTIQPRGATIGRGGSASESDRTASTRSAARSGTTTETRTARIGRRGSDRTSESRTVSQSRTDASARARIGRSVRGDRDRSAVRVGHDSRDESRVARTPSKRPDMQQDGARTRIVRDQSRSRGADRPHSDRRSAAERGRIGALRSDGGTDLRVRTPTRIDASRYEKMRERWERQRAERRRYERRSPFPERRTSTWSQPDRSDRTRARSPSRSSGSDRESSARSGSDRSSSSSDDSGDRGRSRGGDDEG